MQAYPDPRRESDPYALPDVEVWHAPNAETCDVCGCIAVDGFDRGAAAPQCDCSYRLGGHDETQWEHTPGWYWWPCFPGCTPDSDPIGPFDTEEEALADARDGWEGDDYDEA